MINIQSLLEQIANGSSKAFQEFFEFSYADIYRYTSYFISDKELCKDVISDIYFHLWQNRKALSEVQNYENYLFICARNEALKYIKEDCRYQKIRLDDVGWDFLPDDSDPELKAMDKELKDIIELGVNALPSRCRLIFFMVREEGKTYKEVADILSISHRTVHAQMCIAIKKLGVIIKEYRSGLK